MSAKLLHHAAKINCAWCDCTFDIFSVVKLMTDCFVCFCSAECVLRVLFSRGINLKTNNSNELSFGISQLHV